MLHIDDARRIMDAAKAEAANIGKGVTIIVVDPQGMPLLLERLPGAAAFTAFVAEGKACASVALGRDSGELGALAERVPALVQAFADRYGGRFVTIQGAVVVKDAEGAVRGAVGVSGALAEEDEQIARAGLQAL